MRELPKALEMFGTIHNEDHQTVILAPLVGALVEDRKESMALALIGNIDNRYARAILISKVVGELAEQEVEETWEAQPRLTVPALPVTKRKTSFAEVELAFPEERAHQEAKRCLRCDLEK